MNLQNSIDCNGPHHLPIIAFDCFSIYSFLKCFVYFYIVYLHLVCFSKVEAWVKQSQLCQYIIHALMHIHLVYAAFLQSTLSARCLELMSPSIYWVEYDNSLL